MNNNVRLLLGRIYKPERKNCILKTCGARPYDRCVREIGSGQPVSAGLVPRRQTPRDAFFIRPDERFPPEAFLFSANISQLSANRPEAPVSNRISCPSVSNSKENPCSLQSASFFLRLSISTVKFILRLLKMCRRKPEQRYIKGCSDNLFMQFSLTF